MSKFTASDIKGQTVYAVYGNVDYEGNYVVQLHSMKNTAKNFIEECLNYEKHTPKPKGYGKEWEKCCELHPAKSYADSYSIREFEIKE